MPVKGVRAGLPSQRETSTLQSPRELPRGNAPKLRHRLCGFDFDGYDFEAGAVRVRGRNLHAFLAAALKTQPYGISRHRERGVQGIILCDDLRKPGTVTV